MDENVYIYIYMGLKELNICKSCCGFVFLSQIVRFWKWVMCSFIFSLRPLAAFYHLPASYSLSIKKLKPNHRPWASDKTSLRQSASTWINRWPKVMVARFRFQATVTRRYSSTLRSSGVERCSGGNLCTLRLCRLVSQVAEGNLK